jgi:hypothetical protein
MRDYQPSQHRPHVVDRRTWLWQTGGLGGIALASLLQQQGALGEEPKSPLARRPHFPPRAKRVIQIYCPGGLSHVDTFDYKPMLEKRHGKPFDETGELQFFASKPGACAKSYWPFRQRGESGIWVSDLLPKIAGCVDDMAFIYSLQSKSAIHGPAMFMMNTGFLLNGFPSMGAWINYGLGSETDELPAFVVLPDPRGVPPGGPRNWGAGFLPAVYQGTSLVSAKGQAPIANLFPTDQAITPQSEIESRKLLAAFNAKHASDRGGDDALNARISAFELAARLQLSAPEATDLSQETAQTERLYGLDRKETEGFGRQCLLARRLVERGVRFVQVWCGADNVPPPRPNWDAHEDVVDNHGKHGPVLDSGVAALITDLKQRGLLDDTLVMLATEFGRQPAAQGKGRDHNPGAFTLFLAGGGVRGGATYGESDELGYQAAVNPCTTYDLHATVLHLLGLNHEKLTYYHNGIQRRLTDVHGHVIHDLLTS